jgi:hypothetical protein
MEVPVDTLKATISRYNELCKFGKDLGFGKRAARIFLFSKIQFNPGEVRLSPDLVSRSGPG